MTAASRLVYITGASSGIGLALAAHCYERGDRVALVARRMDELEEWIGLQEWVPERYALYRADVRDPHAIGAAAGRCLQTQGLPDVVIANAGISVGIDPALQPDMEVLRATLETNVLGLAATLQPFVAPMCERRSGRLVGIASVAGIRGLPGHAAYCASKAAVIAYCESLRGDCRRHGVRVVTLAPGYIDTPLTQQNRYPMPFLMPAADFAARADAAIEAGVSYRVIPWQMGIVGRLLRGLPNAWFDALAARQPRKHRPLPQLEP
jgi:NAD(P)-dependent dehydrogenase (short-subunit alcohol dehydrogenase family)